MGFKLLLLSDLAIPESLTAAAEWPNRLATELPEIELLIATSPAEAEDSISDVEAAFGFLPPALFAKATSLRWLASPRAGPDPSFYHQAQVDSDVQVTNCRAPFSRDAPNRLKTMEIRGYRRSPVQVFTDKQIEVAEADAPLGAELRGRQITGIHPAADRPLGDPTKGRYVLDGQQWFWGISGWSGHRHAPLKWLGQRRGWRPLKPMVTSAQRQPSGQADGRATTAMFEHPDADRLLYVDCPAA